MARKHNLQQAAAAFNTAAYLAEDGSMVNASILARRAVICLEREWKRRRPLRAGTAWAESSLEAAVDAEIKRRIAARRKGV